MGDNSPGLRLKEFAKLLCKVKNIEKEVTNIDTKGTEAAFAACQLSEKAGLQVASDLPKKPFNVRPVTWSRSPSPARYNKKRDISLSLGGNERKKRVYVVRPETQKLSEGHSKNQKDSSGLNKSSNKSNEFSRKQIRTEPTNKRQKLISGGREKEARRSAESSHQRSSKERVSTCQTRSGRGREERSGNKKTSNRTSRSRSPRREKNLAPREMQEDRARLIKSKNFGEEARRLMEAPLASTQSSSPDIPVVENQCPLFGKPLLDDSPTSEKKLPFASEERLALAADTTTLDERPILDEGLQMDQKLPVGSSLSPSMSLSPAPSPSLVKLSKDVGTKNVSGDKFNNAKDEGTKNADIHMPDLPKLKKATNAITAKSIGTPNDLNENSLTKPSEDLSRDHSDLDNKVITISDDDKDEPEAMKDSIVLVSGLRSSSTKQDLMKAFSRCGRVLRIRMCKRPPGYAFILMEHSYEASQAVQTLHDTEIGGHKMRMEGAAERGISLGNKASAEERKIIQQVFARDANKGNEQKKRREVTENTQKETQRRTQLPKHPASLHADRCELMKNLVVNVQDFGMENCSNSRRVTEQLCDSSAQSERLQKFTSFWTNINWTSPNCDGKQRVIKLKDDNLIVDCESNKKQTLEAESGNTVSSGVESKEIGEIGRMHKKKDIRKTQTSVSGEREILKKLVIQVEDPVLSDDSIAQGLKEVSKMPSTNPRKNDNISNSSDLYPSDKDPTSNKDCTGTKEVKVENNDESTNLPRETGRVLEKVTGLIFQVSPEAILFEFTLEEDTGQFQVGMVEPCKVWVGDRNIPAAAVKMKETLDRYVKVGDELECILVKEEGMAMVSVQEENEEGNMVEVEIQPDWKAR